jgi:murein DD-endopeptidase MepM/ murein hydrolase activator NlpD
MMRDYKFRVRGHGFRREPKRQSRRALRLGLIALTAGASYALIQVMVSSDSLPLTAPPTGSEVIELPLPPGPLQDQSSLREPPPKLSDYPTARWQTEAIPANESRPDTEREARDDDSLHLPLRIATETQADRLAASRRASSLALVTSVRPPQTTPNIARDIIDPELLALFDASMQKPRALSHPVVLVFSENTPLNSLSSRPALVADASNRASIEKAPPALRAGPFRLDYRVQSGDTLSTILQDQGISSRLVHDILNKLSTQHRQRLERIRPGETISLHLDAALELERLEFKLDAVDRLLVARDGDSISTEIKSAPTEPRRLCLTAVVKNSLYGAAKSAGIPDQITQRAINIFRNQINFARQTRPGDQISVLFEQIYAGEQPIKTGPVLAVEITSGKKQYAAVRYTTSKGTTDYYSVDGDPLDKSKHSFLRAPLTYSRVSSRFSHNRLHPILGRVRPHTGVDFAAPAGRRVLAAANGRVHFKGRKSGYGNILILKHGARYETRYAHLMRFAKGIADGGTVKRGETIGYVGQTGLATGPHLHYEVRINGTPVDPLTAKLPFLNEFDDKEKTRFRQLTRPLLAELQRNRERALLVDARQFNQGDDGFAAAGGDRFH